MIHTEREKIKRSSLLHIQQNTQKASLCKQNHEKKPQKHKINEKNDNININISKYYIINHFEVIKNENTTKKYEQKYNSIYNILGKKMGPFLNNKGQEGVHIYIKQYKLTNDIKCHLCKNNTIIIIKIIKHTTYHNTTKYTQQKNTKTIIHKNNIQIKLNKRMTLDTKC
jgi:hypothetical protein